MSQAGPRQPLAVRRASDRRGVAGRGRRGAQATVAAFGWFALQSRDLDLTLRRALGAAAEVLDVPAAILVRRAAPGRASTVSSYWGEEGHAGLPIGEEFDVSPELERVWSGGRLLAVSDWDSEPAGGVPSPWRSAGLVSSLGVSIPVSGRVWGRLVVGDFRVRDWFEDEAAFVQSLVNVLSAALERHADEAAQLALAEFGRFALVSRDLAATLDEAARTAARALDVGTAAVSRRDGPGRLRLVSVTGWFEAAAPDELRLTPELDQAWVAAGPVRIEDWRAERRFAPPRPWPEAAVSHLSATVQLAGRIWGRLAGFDVQARKWRDTDAALLQTLANTLAAAVERDWMESRLRDRARQLQEVILPAQLPDVPGVETAVRYVPADGLEVGGDWYDVLELPHGGVALVIGDVEGHDSAAAAVVGQVRTVVRTYAGDGLPPGEILSRVNGFVSALGDRLVTCCYVQLHPASRTASCVSAGHPPPLLLTSAGEVQEIAVHTEPPLGVDVHATYPERTTLLPAGGSLLLFTDGLLDVLPGVIHRDLAAIAEAARPVLSAPIEELADRLVARPRGAAALRDDAALLLVRMISTNSRATRHVARVFGPHLSACPAARSYVHDVLTCWGLADVREEAELVASELVANALTHGSGPPCLTLRRVGRDRLWIGVQDRSDRQPRLLPATAGAVNGRGLHIVEQFADSWGVTSDAQRSGKTVWLQLTPPARRASKAAVQR